ncbi:YuzF family protein [Bacillus sp. FJAT-45037]|uniref:YuzF family protein n=1 Tax=Bacillus sp. FJAT-45037 TaxID=2011007 RepID=UPI000C232B62|nr:YuzF family protein [Bacillus sp. FJAT-45037]
MNNQNDYQVPQMTSPVDPYVVQTLQSITGNSVVIETTRGNVQGTITDVKPDHVVIESNDSSFFVRIQQIVWIMPN